MVAAQSECQLCSMCQLICTLKHEKAFNPSKAFIKLSKVIKPSGELDVAISFTEECDNCGLCARYCFYGALSRVKAADTSGQPARSGRRERSKSEKVGGEI